jgi:hypothetical protein
MEFALQMYVIGYLKAEFTTVILVASESWDDCDFDDLDLTPVYERIVELIQNRGEDIQDAVAQDY